MLDDSFLATLYAAHATSRHARISELAMTALRRTHSNRAAQLDPATREARHAARAARPILRRCLPDHGAR